MNQEQFDIIMKALVFASTCDASADTTALERTIDGIKHLVEMNPELADNVNLDGITLYGDAKMSEEPEKYTSLVELFGDKLKIEL